jgi:EAL domain-containing protein (putative c-di-GMP-specific phosphodiesterase class I)
VSVNISATQFRGGDLVKLVSAVLASTGLPADLLELEITERVLIDDNLNVSRILEDLKRLGVRLALDDFGTGYSSLGYLKRFHFDVLKIDRMFVSDIATDPETDALCRAIVAMADSLKLDVVAEGVETDQQFRLLRSLGVNLVQGFYLSYPVPSEELFKLFTRRNILLRPV